MNYYKNVSKNVKNTIQAVTKLTDGRTTSTGSPPLPPCKRLPGLHGRVSVDQACCSEFYKCSI